jgi:hypothetical protein
MLLLGGQPIMSGLTTKGTTLGTDLDTLLNNVPTMKADKNL